MRFAYADPPYLGQSKKLYGDHPDAEVYDAVEGHAALVERLVDEYPDGWAMSLSAPSLRFLLPLCPDDVRIGSWVKGWCSWKPGTAVAYAWEPVIFRGGRPAKERAWKTRDWVMCNATTRLPKEGLTKGAKPMQFCRWVFGILGATADDELVDLFPGSGAVGHAWGSYIAQPSLLVPAVQQSGTVTE